jgi:hypothetical protein
MHDLCICGKPLLLSDFDAFPRFILGGPIGIISFGVAALQLYVLHLNYLLINHAGFLCLFKMPKVQKLNFFLGYRPPLEPLIARLFFCCIWIIYFPLASKACR